MALPLGINELKYIAESLTQRFGFDYNNFSLSFLKRRLTLVFDELNIKKIEQFIQQLSDNDFVEKFHYLFAVSCSEIFRDPSFWRALRFRVLSNEDCPNQIWFPDASSGEEVFSMLILLADADLIDKYDVHCNHISGKNLEEIKKGILKDRNLEVNENNFKRFGGKGQFFDYFDLCEEGIRLKPMLTANLYCHNRHFSEQTFDKKPSITIFRNSMLYFTKKYSVDAVISIYNVMCPRGYLAIGIKENLPDPVLGNMLPYDNNEQIYKRHPASVAIL